MKQIIVFIVLCCLTTSYALGQKHSFTSYRTEHGLIQSDVTCINQDNKGRLWVGTVAGLSLFDGVKFTNFTTANGLAEEWITSICPDPNTGHVWMGHFGGQMSLYNSFSNSFQSINTHNIFGSSPILQVTLSDSGNLFVLNESNQLFVMHPDSMIFTEIQTNFNGIFSIHIVGDYLICNTEQGIYQYTDQNWKLISDQQFKLFSINKNNAFGLVNNTVVSFSVAFKGRKVNLKQKHSSEVSINGYDNITSRNNRCILSTDNGSITIIEGQSVNYLIEASGLVLPKINTCFLDKSDKLWIGSAMGIDLYLGRQFLQYDKDHIGSNVVWDVLKFNEHIICATSNGVQVLNENGEVSFDLCTEQHINQIIGNGSLLITGSNAGLLSIFNKEFNLIKELNLKSGITALEFEKKQRLLIGTESGLYRLNLESLKIESLIQEKELYVLDIHKSADNQILISTNDGGIRVLTSNELTIPKKYESFKNYLIFSIASTEEITCLGSYGNGLFIIKKDSTFTLNSTNGLQSSSIYALAVKDSNLFAGSNNGFDVLNLKDFSIRSYSKQEGFNGIEVNHNAIFSDNNEVLFGSLLGVIKMNGSSEGLDKFNPFMELTNIYIDGKKIIPPADNVYFSYDNNLTFDYVAYSPVLGGGITYKTKLLPIDSNYSLQGSNRTVSYTNLKPGKYELSIIAISASGQQQILTYNFQIKVPFFEEPWFFMIQLGVLLLLFLLAAFYGRRTKGSRMATIIATIAVIILFEWLLSVIESDIESYTRGVAFIKISLNVLLALILFPVEKIIKGALVKKE